MIGFHPKMPKDKYLAVEALSNSGLKQLDRSPAHFKAPPKPIDTTKQTTFDIGTAFHTATLEPELYDKEVIVTSQSKVSAKEKTEAAKEGKVIIKSPAHNNIMGMAEAVQKHPEAGPLVQGGVTEISCFWKDPVHKFLCKLRADKINDNKVVIDLKSTTDAADDTYGFGSFRKNFTNLGYHRQAQWYLEGITIASGVDHEIFAFIAVEKDPPHGVNVFIPTKEVLLWAMEEIEVLKERYAECLEKNEWPCYETGIKTIELPKWAKQ